MINMETVALQMYTVREALADDFSGTMDKIADYGYRAIEIAGFPEGVSPESAKSTFDNLGIQVVAAHSPLPSGDDSNLIIDTLKAVDTTNLVCPWLDPGTYYSDLDGIKKACEMLNEANAVCKDAGLTLLYHNHWFEMQEVEGKIAYQHMLELLEDDVQFELDSYWAKVAGLDPVNVINDMRSRLPFIHLKDGLAQNTKDNMLALGAGAMDIPAILEASPAQWHVVELDRCDTDMMTAVQESYAYLQSLQA